MDIAKSYRKKILTIPNILSLFRIILIPIFAYVYTKAESSRDYYIAAGILWISVITDFLDGKIARKFNMISDLGKVLDPVADKLTHLVIAICLITRYPFVMWLVLLMILKEAYMAIMSIYILKTRAKKLDGAKMYGKVCTTILFFVLLALVLLPQIKSSVAVILVFLAGISLIITWILYIPEFRKMTN
jgi:cardiolipin synthase (CMP-forming)